MLSRLLRLAVDLGQKSVEKEVLLFRDRTVDGGRCQKKCTGDAKTYRKCPNLREVT